MLTCQRTRKLAVGPIGHHIVVRHAGRWTGSIATLVLAIAPMLAACTNSVGVEQMPVSPVSPSGAAVSKASTDDGSASASHARSMPVTGPTEPSGDSGTRPVSRSSRNRAVVSNSEDEIATRKKIETAWIKYWDVYIAFNRIPRAQRSARYGAVAADRELAGLLRTADLADRQHLENFGVIGHQISWSAPVSGRSTVAVSDCQDQSDFGYLDSRSHKVLGVGPAVVLYVGTLQRGEDGAWRVTFRDLREGRKC